MNAIAATAAPNASLEHARRLLDQGDRAVLGQRPRRRGAGDARTDDHRVELLPGHRGEAAARSRSRSPRIDVETARSRMTEAMWSKVSALATSVLPASIASRIR